MKGIRLAAWAVIAMWLAAAVGPAVQAASPWSLKASPAHVLVEQKARVILSGPVPNRAPVLVVVEDGSPLRFPFHKIGNGRYEATASLLVPGSLTLTAKAGTEVLATTTVTVAPHPGGSGLRALAGLILIGFVLYFWYRSRRFTGTR
jgi:hypothetical protein